MDKMKKYTLVLTTHDGFQKLLDHHGLPTNLYYPRKRLVRGKRPMDADEFVVESIRFIQGQKIDDDTYIFDEA